MGKLREPFIHRGGTSPMRKMGVEWDDWEVRIKPFLLEPWGYVLSKVRITCNTSSDFVTRMLGFLLILDQGVRFGWNKKCLKV